MADFVNPNEFETEWLIDKRRVRDLEARVKELEAERDVLAGGEIVERAILSAIVIDQLRREKEAAEAELDRLDFCNGFVAACETPDLENQATSAEVLECGGPDLKAGEGTEKPIQWHYGWDVAIVRSRTLNEHASTSIWNEAKEACAKVVRTEPHYDLVLNKHVGVSGFKTNVLASIRALERKP